MCFIKFGLRAQCLLVILDWIVNIIGGGRGGDYITIYKLKNLHFDNKEDIQMNSKNNENIHGSKLLATILH